MLSSWRVVAELSGGHTVQQTLQFVNALADVEDPRQRALPAGFVPADSEPRWRTMLGRWFGR